MPSSQSNSHQSFQLLNCTVFVLFPKNCAKQLLEDYDVTRATSYDIHSLYCIYNAAWTNKDQLTSDSCMAQTRCTSSVVRYLEIDM